MAKTYGMRPPFVMPPPKLDQAAPFHFAMPLTGIPFGPPARSRSPPTNTSLPLTAMDQTDPRIPPPKGDQVLPSHVTRLPLKVPAKSRLPSDTNANGRRPRLPTGVQACPSHLDTPLMVVP